MSDLRHFFGLRNDPFPQNLPVKDLYPLPALEPLEKRVIFAVEQRALTVITGDVGSGKSTSLRYIGSRLHSSEYHLLSLVGGSYSLMELYRNILLCFGIECHGFQVSMMVHKIRQLVTEIAERKVTPVLIIDEAHLLRPPIFAQLHTLVQFEYDSRPLMPIIFCGQDLLLDHLMSIPARPLASRILGRSHLEALRREVMIEYLSHHIRLAGASKNPFTDEAVFAIHQGSGGLLRGANSLAKASMLAAAIEQNSSVSAEHVRMASTEIF
ncbi:MAG: AAA family ATPase [Spirochaetaceae bacterium]|nr:AAA family ATPase [Spirochaetaceae bacterium]